MKCRHKWERVQTRVQDRQVVWTEDHCAKCGRVRIVSDAAHDALRRSLDERRPPNAALKKLLEEP